MARELRKVVSVSAADDLAAIQARWEVLADLLDTDRITKPRVRGDLRRLLYIWHQTGKEARTAGHAPQHVSTRPKRKAPPRRAGLKVEGRPHWVVRDIHEQITPEVASSPVKVL